MNPPPGAPYHAERDGFIVSADPARIDAGAVERLLSTAYWASGRSQSTIRESLRNSRCFGLYDARSGRQAGFMRVVTDYATFAWLCDVIIEEGLRGKGLGTWMLEFVLNDPEMQSVTRWILATGDAHALYARFGFTPMAKPDVWMERILSKTDCTQPS